MAKNDNAHALRLVNSLQQNAGHAAAEEFGDNYPLSKSASIEKRYEWARSACSYLEEHFETDAIIAIRKECRCNDGKSIANKLLKYLNRADCIEGFVDLFNESETFAALEYISDHEILFCYPNAIAPVSKEYPGSYQRPGATVPWATRRGSSVRCSRKRCRLLCWGVSRRAQISVRSE